MMRASNIAILDEITLEELEEALDRHTRDRVPVTQWTAFSWSTSRHGTFERCKRQYYLNYYGARRVREAKSKVVSAIWWLKQITGHATWIGTVMHHIAGEAIKAYRDRNAYARDALLKEALDYYQGGVRSSQRGSKFENQWVSLMEDAYDDIEAPDDGVQRITELVDALLNSEAYGLIASLPPSALLEVDEPFQSFTLYDVPLIGELKTFAIPDVLVEVADGLRIIDWKTGRVDVPELQMQAGVYRLYAHMQYRRTPEEIGVDFVALADGGQSVETPGGLPSIEETREWVHASVVEMVEHMDDLRYNTVSISDFPRTDNLAMCTGCGFKRACWRHVSP